MREEVTSALQMEEIYTDEGMVEKTKQVVETLNSFKNAAPSEEVISKILKIQELVREIKSDD